MSATLPMPRARRAWPAQISSATIALACIAAATLLFRAGQFGNPIAGLDEQFYLLVGDRMWHGELPYVDIWDRKPFGLFVLFAAIRLLPGDGILAAQVVAAAFVGATAWCVVRLTRREVGWLPATMTGIFYIAGLNELWGETTQTPVFYNLLTAIAALLTLHAGGDPRIRVWSAMAAMLLAGMAMQIKTSAVFQGAFFGLWLLVAMWRDTRSWPMVIGAAVRWASIGFAPTLAAMAIYAAIGEFPAWWQANVTSILTKADPSPVAATKDFAESLVFFLPAGILAGIGLWAQTRHLEVYTARTAFYAGWIAFSVADFLSLGSYYAHYALPLLLACSPLVAHAFALRWTGRPMFILSMLWPLVYATWLAPAIGALERRHAAQVVAHIPASVRDRCMFVYEGPVAYYGLTNACRVTRYAFSAHLSSRREGPSLGVDPAAELDAVMARRPAVVLTVEHLRWLDRNLDMERRLGRYLLRDYRLRARLPHRYYSDREKLLLWVRR